MRVRLEATYRELFTVRFRLATMQLTNHRELPRVKKTISRIKTIQRERELARIYGG
ncbi:MAG: 50S ribosomal protein L29 [Chloroflexi bacterium]|nr:50S ribosomal protein L29 [Chloroflexota bacterium]